MIDGINSLDVLISTGTEYVHSEYVACKYKRRMHTHVGMSFFFKCTHTPIQVYYVVQVNESWESMEFHSFSGHSGWTHHVNDIDQYQMSVVFT